MIETGNVYSIGELSQILGTRGKQGIDRKLQRYGVECNSFGHGDKRNYEIIKIDDPFKLYAIIELGCDANTDFKKMRNFYWYYFNDEIFRAMPNEAKEKILSREDINISRQTITNYTQILIDKNLIDANTVSGDEYVYYFACKGEQRFVERSEYNCAWKEYWSEKTIGESTYSRIQSMINKYGGVARKQPIPRINGIYNKDIEYMCSLIQQSLENET